MCVCVLGNVISIRHSICRFYLSNNKQSHTNHTSKRTAIELRRAAGCAVDVRRVAGKDNSMLGRDEARHVMALYARCLASSPPSEGAIELQQQPPPP